MELLKELLKKYRAQACLLFIVGVASTLTGLLFIDMGRRVINVVSAPDLATPGDYRLLLVYCAVILLAMFVGGSLNYWIEVLFVRLSQAILRDIRLRLFSHVLTLPQRFHNEHPVGQLLSLIINDVTHIGQFFSKGLLTPVMSLFLVAFSAAYLFYLNWKLAAAAIVTVTWVVFFLPRFNRRLADLSARYSASMGELSNYIQEALSGLSDIRANQTYRFETARLSDKIRHFIGINMAMAQTAGSLGFLMEIIRGSGPLLVYLYGGFLCLRGDMSVGTLVATLSVIYTLYGPAGSFVGFLQEWRQVRVRFDKLDEYLRLAPEEQVVPEEPGQRTPLGTLRFDQVNFGFSEGEMLLKDLSFMTGPGQSLALVGPSGSGKSLTTALITRTYEPLSGKIALGEADLETIPLHALRSQIGQVSQTPFLFNDTLKNNLLYSLLNKTRGEEEKPASFIDFSPLPGIDSLEALNREIFRVVREVGLYEDVYELGLRAKLSSIPAFNTPDHQALVLKARGRFMQETRARGLTYVEHYDENLFLEFLSLLGNLIFGAEEEIVNKFGSLQSFCQNYLNPLLKERGMLEKLFRLGVNLVRADALLLDDLYSRHSPLLSRLDLDSESFRLKMKIREQKVLLSEPLRLEELDPSLVEHILELAYRYVPGKAKEDLMEAGLREELLGVRKALRAELPKSLGAAFPFFDPQVFLPEVSLRENLIFGNIDPARKKANEVVNELIRLVAAEEGLEELILSLGLEFQVGERGNKLSGGQRQKVAIARMLLKNPGIIILDEATANLDGASQARIAALIRERFADRMVISIAHRLGIVKNYDNIVVLDHGAVVQQGSFAELIRQDGLFKKLYEESA